MTRSLCLFAITSLIAVQGCGSGGASASGSSPSRNASTIGTSSGHLVDANGFTLYQASGSCTGSCLMIWPPATVSQTPTATGSASQAKMGLSSGQATYSGQLLYYFDEDGSAGQTNGNGVGGFSVVSP